MTLKEKITKTALDMPLINAPSKKEISDYENGISNLEQIAEEFAIEFAMHISTHCYCELGNDTRSYKELLEIYKKEKGL